MPAPPTQQLTEDWGQFDPTAYLDEYYGDIGSENLALLRFLADTYPRIPKGGVLLDFGGGPTIYPLISAAMRFDEIHFSDYLESNLDEVRRWLAADPLAFDWDAFIRKALEMELGVSCTEDEVAHRANEIRRRVTNLIRCDASQEPPIECATGTYDVVLTNFCAESATSDWDEWRSFTSNILSMLKPGGWLVMSALKGAARYAVGPRSFPAVRISEDDLIDVLAANGFSTAGIEVQTVAADRPSRDYEGLMLVLAQKDATWEQPKATG